MSCQPPIFTGHARLLTKLETGEIKECASRGSPGTLPPALRLEATGLARRLVKGAPVSRDDTPLDAVRAAIRISARAVAGGIHGRKLRRGWSRNKAARWLREAHARIEAAFPDGGVL
jgi:hypothetical protein